MTKHKGARPPASLAPARAAVNPAVWGYGFGAALIILGLLVLSIALGSALRSATHGVHKLSFPGRHTLNLKEGLYVGILPAVKGALPAGDVQVTITDEGGRPVPQMAFPPELAQANKKIGTTLFQAQVPYDDRYVVEGAGTAEILLIHESLSRNPMDIAVGVILMVVLGGFGLYVLFVTYRRKRLAAAAASPELSRL